MRHSYLRQLETSELESLSGGGKASPKLFYGYIVYIAWRYIITTTTDSTCSPYTAYSAADIIPSCAVSIISTDQNKINARLYIPSLSLLNLLIIPRSRRIIIPCGYSTLCYLRFFAVLYISSA